MSARSNRPGVTNTAGTSGAVTRMRANSTQKIIAALDSVLPMRRSTRSEEENSTMAASAATWPRLSSAKPGRSTISRSEEHTSELQSLMRISYAVFCLKKQKTEKTTQHTKNKHTT